VSTASTQETAPAGTGVAFDGPPWNGWALFALALVSILAFVSVQVIVLAIIFFKAYPDALSVAQTRPLLAQPATLMRLLTAPNLWVLTVSSEGVLAVITLAGLRALLNAPPSAIGLAALPRPGALAFGVGWGILLVLASNLAEALQNVVFGPHPPQMQAQVLLAHHGAEAFALDFMAVSIAAPFAEETFFRGLIFTGLVQRMQPGYAALFSAAFFAIAHFEKWSALPIFLIGLGLAYVYYTSKSLWVSMTTHATVNTISLVIAYLFPQLVK
jgi:membrane protease YdiL (CAAX protease family)